MDEKMPTCVELVTMRFDHPGWFRMDDFREQVKDVKNKVSVARESGAPHFVDLELLLGRLVVDVLHQRVVTVVARRVKEADYQQFLRFFPCESEHLENNHIYGDPFVQEGEDQRLDMSVALFEQLSATYELAHGFARPNAEDVRSVKMNLTRFFGSFEDPADSHRETHAMARMVGNGILNDFNELSCRHLQVPRAFGKGIWLSLDDIL